MDKLDFKEQAQTLRRLHISSFGYGQQEESDMRGNSRDVRLLRRKIEMPIFFTCQQQ